MQNGSSGHSTGARTEDETEGQPGVSEPDHEPARIAPERQQGTSTNRSRISAELAAAITTIKELYERESAGLMDPIDAPDGEHDLPRQRADNMEAERDAARMEAETAKARAARAVAALAGEHETRLAAEVELDRLRAEVEVERERTHEANQQAQAAGERAERAEAEAIQLHREIEVRHHRAEQEHARLVEEANGFQQRAQAAEVEVVQLRQVEIARRSFVRRTRILGIAMAILLSASALYVSSPPNNRITSAVASILTTWGAAKEKVPGKSAIKPDDGRNMELTVATPEPQSSAPIVGAGESRTPAATPESGPGRIQIRSQVAPDFSAQQDRDDRPQASGHEQQLAIAALAQTKSTEGKSALSTSVSADPLSVAEHIQPQTSDSTPQKEQVDAAQEAAQAKVEPQQAEPTPTGDKMEPSPGTTHSQPSRLSTTPTSLPTKEIAPERKLVTEAVAAHVSIHYRPSSPSARADAEQVGTWLASSGFGASHFLSTQRVLREQVVRYFFVEDAEVAKRIVGELLKRGGRWRVDDCTHYRHKPRAGNIQVWPIQDQIP